MSIRKGQANVNILAALTSRQGKINRKRQDKVNRKIIMIC